MPTPTPSKRKRIIAPFAFVILVVAAGAWYRHEPPLPHFFLRDGAEFRVYQMTYTSRPSYSLEHNLDAPHLRWWIYDHAPAFLHRRLPMPSTGIGSTGSDLPMLSIWWGRVDPKTHQPEIGPAGDVLMTLDSGEVISLSWPSPHDDESRPNGPSYRQITVTPVPANSKTLTFEVPTEDETVRFTIKNPAYRRP